MKYIQHLSNELVLWKCIITTSRLCHSNKPTPVTALFSTSIYASVAVEAQQRFIRLKPLHFIITWTVIKRVPTVLNKPPLPDTLPRRIFRNTNSL